MLKFSVISGRSRRLPPPIAFVEIDPRSDAGEREIHPRTTVSGDIPLAGRCRSMRPRPKPKTAKRGLNTSHFHRRSAPDPSASPARRASPNGSLPSRHEPWLGRPRLRPFPARLAPVASAPANAKLLPTPPPLPDFTVDFCTAPMSHRFLGQQRENLTAETLGTAATR